ncbi:hypothetical protein J6590_037806 [Homalodisca vitripennis]|nr:hypothetical protein J6590_037806 [Homalodisca vitripennis]
MIIKSGRRRAMSSGTTRPGSTCSKGIRWFYRTSTPVIGSSLTIKLNSSKVEALFRSFCPRISSFTSLDADFEADHLESTWEATHNLTVAADYARRSVNTRMSLEQQEHTRVPGDSIMMMT